MSSDRKILKIISLCMMALGIAALVAEIVLSVLGQNSASKFYIILACILSIVSLVTGYLGIRTANSPRKGLQNFKHACGEAAVAGLCFSVYFCLTSGFNNPANYLGVLVAGLACIGLYYTNKLNKTYQS